MNCAYFCRQAKRFTLELNFWLICSEREYEDIAEETLESLSTYFDDLLELGSIPGADVNYGVSPCPNKIIMMSDLLIQ